MRDVTEGTRSGIWILRLEGTSDDVNVHSRWCFSKLCDLAYDVREHAPPSSLRCATVLFLFLFFSSEGKWTCLATHVDDECANKGTLFIAVRGHGASTLMPTAHPRSCSCCRVRVRVPRAVAEATYAPSGTARALLPRINREWTRSARHPRARAELVRMDSQVKYAALACGEGGGGVYIRFRNRKVINMGM